MAILVLLGMLAAKPEPVNDLPRSSGRPHSNECPMYHGMAIDVLRRWEREHRNEAQNR